MARTIVVFAGGLSTAFACTACSAGDPESVADKSAEVVFGGESRLDFFPAHGLGIDLANQAVSVGVFFDNDELPDRQVIDCPTTTQFCTLSTRSDHFCSAGPPPPGNVISAFAHQKSVASTACSAFLVDDNLFATAAHCLDEVPCDRAAVVMRWWTNDCGTSTCAANTAIDPVHVFHCTNVVAKGCGFGVCGVPDHDWALFEVEDSVVRTLTTPPVPREPLALRRSKRVPLSEPGFMIGHPAALPLKVDISAQAVIGTTPGHFRAETDESRGSSGSPFIDEPDRRVHGVLSAGPPDTLSQALDCFFERSCSSASDCGSRPSFADVRNFAHFVPPREWNVPPGGVLDLAAGVDGSVFAVGTSSNLFRWSETFQKFNPVSSSGTNHLRVAVEPGGVPWTVKSDKSIHRLEDGADFSPSGEALDIATNENGEVFLVGTSGRLFRWDLVASGGHFQPRTGLTSCTPAARDVAGGLTEEVWVAGTDNVICRGTASGFTRLPGSALDITVTENGTAFIVDTSGKILRFDPPSNSFVSVPGTPTNARRIAAGVGDVLYIVQADKAIRRWTSGLLETLPGEALDVAASRNGHLFVVGTSKRLFRWDNLTSTFALVSTPSQVFRVAVEPGGVPWIVTSASGSPANGIHRIQGTTTFTAEGGATDIGIAPDGGLFVVGTSGKVFKYQLGGEFITVPGTPSNLRKIAADVDSVWAIDTNQQLRRFTGGTWQNAGITAKHVDATAYRSVFVVDPTDVIKHFHFQTAPGTPASHWVAVANAPLASNGVAIEPSGAVWAVMSNNTLQRGFE